MTEVATPRPKRLIVMLCPNCLRENEPSAHFCKFCVTPLTFHAATDPVKHIYAEMDTIGKAARSPRNFIVVAGMLLLTGPFLLFSLALVGSLFSAIASDGIGEHMGDLVVGLVEAAVIAVIPVILLSRMFSNFQWTPMPIVPEPDAGLEPMTAHGSPPAWRKSPPTDSGPKDFLQGNSAESTNN